MLSINGVILMLINSLSIASLDIFAKTLRLSMDSVHIVFLYKCVFFIMCLPWVLYHGSIKTEKILHHVIRSLTGVSASIAYLHGLKGVHVSDALSLQNANDIILVLIGMIFFKEKFSWTKLIAVIIGFAGAVFVVHPELFDINNRLLNYDQEFNYHYLYILLSMALWIMGSLIVKLLGKTEKDHTQVFYVALFSVIWSCIGALQSDITIYQVIIDVNQNQMFFIFMMALMYFIHAIVYFRALKYNLSIVMPFNYMKMIFGGMIGYIVFNEVPTLYSYVGYTLIIIAGLMIARYVIRNNRATT